MAMGIPEYIFWNLNPKKLEPYREAERLKLKQQNFAYWLQGLYFHEGVAVALTNAFSKKKAKYPKEPYEIVPPSATELAQKAELERQKAIAFFNAMARGAGQETLN